MKPHAARTKHSIAVFLVVTMCSVHAQSLVGSVNALEDFGLELGIVNDGSCDVDDNMLAEFQRGAWTSLCYRVNGALEQLTYVELHVQLVADSGAVYQLTESELLLQEDTYQRASTERLFDVYVPSDVDLVENYRVVLDYTLQAYPSMADLGQGSSAVEVFFEMQGAPQYSLEVEASETVFSQGSQATLTGVVKNFGNLTEHLQLELVDQQGSPLGADIVQVRPTSQTTLGLLFDASNLPVGETMLYLQSRANSTGEKQEQTISVIITEPSAEVLLNDVEWSEVGIGTPMHPGGDVVVLANISNDGALEGGQEFGLSCSNDGSFSVFDHVVVPARSHEQYTLNFTLPPVEQFGFNHCIVSGGGTTFSLPVRDMQPWPVEMGMVLQSLNSTVADSQDDVVLATEDEALVVNYGLQNLGFSSESVDWMLQAKLQNTDSTRTLAQGRSVLDVNGSTVVGYNGTVPTCDDGIWDLELVATDRHGDQHRQAVLGAFNTTREPIRAEVEADLVGTETNYKVGEHIPVSVTVRGLQSSSPCHQHRPLRIALQDETGSDVFIHESTVNVVANIDTTVDIMMPTQAAHEGGRYSLDVRLYDRSTDATTVSSSTGLGVVLEAPETLLETSCLRGDEQLSSSAFTLSCTLSHNTARSVHVKSHLFINGVLKDHIQSKVQANEQHAIRFSTYLDGWGEQSVQVVSSVLTDGEWVNQTGVFEFPVVAVHPQDDGVFLKGWQVYPDVPQAGQTVDIGLTVRGVSSMLGGHLNLTMNDGGGPGVPLLATVPVDAGMPIGHLEHLSVSMPWPMECSDFTITLEAYDAMGIRILPLPDGIDDSITRTACPTMFPDLVVSESRLAENGTLSVVFENIGNDMAAGMTWLSTLYLDGVYTQDLETPSLAGGETHEHHITPTTSFSEVTVAVDSHRRVTERHEGSSNVFSIDLNLQTLAFYEADVNGDGQLNAEELAQGVVLDSDGDGLSDELEQNGWGVSYISHMDQMKAINTYLETMEEDPDQDFPSVNEAVVFSSTDSVDADGDGLTDLGEFLQGTNPDDPDTDGDGLTDLEEVLDERQDPLMVELDAPVLQALAPKIVGQPFAKTTFELFFAVNEPNLESVEVVVRKNGDDRTVIPEEVVDSSRPQALQDGDIGRVFKAQYTISDFRAFHDIEVFVKTVDLFGQENEISVANYSSLKSRVTTGLSSFAMDLHPALRAAAATTIGFLYSVFVVLQDFADMVISVGKLFLMLITGALWDAIKGIVSTVVDVLTSLQLDKVVDATKSVAKGLWKMAKELSPFQDNASNASFLGAFIIGFIGLTLVVESFVFTKASRALSKKDMTDFVVKGDEAIEGMRASSKAFEDNPALVMKKWQKTPTGKAKKTMFDFSEEISNKLLDGALSDSKWSGIYRVIGKGYMWFGKRLNADAAFRLSRGLDFMDAFKDSQKWKLAAERGTLAGGLDLARRAINHPDLFKSMNGFDAVTDGSKMQRAAMENFADSLFDREGVIKPYSQLKGTLDELSQVGSLALPDNLGRITTVAPGPCRACDSLDGITTYDRDIIRVHYDADGNIVRKEIIDRKHYNSPTNVRNEIAENVLNRNGRNVVDYQKEQFKRYLPDTPDNREKYVQDLVEKTGISKSDAMKNYDFDKDWVNGVHDDIQSIYEPVVAREGVYYGGRDHEIFEIQRLDGKQKVLSDIEVKYFGPDAKCALCGEMNEAQKRAFLEDMYNTQWGVRGVSGAGGGGTSFSKSIHSLGDKDWVSEILDDKVFATTGDPVSATVSYEQSTLAKFIEKAPVLLGGLVGLIALLALAVRIRKKPPLAS